MKRHLPRVAVVQPALPTFRLDFFERVWRVLGPDFAVFYSPSSLGILSEAGVERPWAHRVGAMCRILPGAEWQQGVINRRVLGADVIVVSGAPRGLSNMVLLILARLRGTQTIWWGHYWSSTSRPHRFLLRMLLMRLATAVIFYTDAEVKEYRAGPGKNDRRLIGALNNGINVEHIQRNRAEYVAATRPPAALFIGRLTEKTKLPLILDALASPSLAGVVLHVIGDGPDRHMLQALAVKIGVDDKIHWHDATTDEVKIAAVANACRVFVYPGSVGLSLIHAMGYGLPAVVHGDRWAHMPEISAFEAGATGLSFARDDGADLAQKLALAVNSIDDLDRWSAAARERVDRKFNTQVMADRFISLAAALFHGTDAHHVSYHER